jgi:hypothetical protein
VTQYLLSVYQPGEEPPADVDIEKIKRDVNALNDEMKDAGVWVFAGGLHAPSTATVLRPDGEGVIATDGPFAEGKEVLGGFTVIEAGDLDEALAWGRKAAQATTLPVEVRPFQNVVGH